MTVTLSGSAETCSVEVRDRGIGLPEGAADEIFQPFGRAENAAHLPGMGMGLFIARQIVEAHGGKLTAESSGEGSGSVFRVTLPATERQLAAAS